MVSKRMAAYVCFAVVGDRLLQLGNVLPKIMQSHSQATNTSKGCTFRALALLPGIRKVIDASIEIES